MRSPRRSTRSPSCTTMSRARCCSGRAKTPCGKHAVADGRDSLQRLPLVLLHARNDAKAALAEWLDYRRFAFLQIRRSSEGGERVAVADDDRIVARRNDGCRQQRL